MEQADLYFAGDILRLLNSNPDEFAAATKHLRVSAMLFSGNDNFGDIMFNSSKAQWEFNSPADESGVPVIEFAGKTMISKDEQKNISKILSAL